jgi:phospholipid/cholesterol/gamma-HCH transport system substrate-binding protein
MKRLRRSAISLLVLFVLVFGTVTLIRTANGDFAGDYPLLGMFPKAGEGLQPGSEVVFRGVQVGRVSTIALKDNEAQIKVLIDPSFKVPKTATATIEPVNLFGAEQVSLSTPDGNSQAGPYLPRNGTFAHAATSDELGDLFAAAEPLLKQINARALSTVLGELGQASQGEGPNIAASISAGTQLAGLLNSTLNSQLNALDSFARFAQAVGPDAASLNNLNAEINAGLPTFNAEEANYEKLLNTLIPFANDLAGLLATYMPDIDTILTSGANVSRVLLAQQDNIGQVVQGAYHYFLKIAQGAKSLTTLPDGSTYVYFNTFVLFSDVNSLVCSLIAPDSAGWSFLEPLQQALSGAGTAFNCSSQLSQFKEAQYAATPVLASASTASSKSAAQSTATEAYGLVGQPDRSKNATIGSYVEGLLGGAS